MPVIVPLASAEACEQCDHIRCHVRSGGEFRGTVTVLVATTDHNLEVGTLLAAVVGITCVRIKILCLLLHCPQAQRLIVEF